MKEVAHPKFYWFDSGVLHAATGGFDQPLPAAWDGVLFEHFVLHELRSYLHYAGVKGSLGYWRTPNGMEVDFVWWHGKNTVVIDAKHGQRYRKEYRKGIDAFRAARAARGYIVYGGSQELVVDDIPVLPLESFVGRLHAGEIIG